MRRGIRVYLFASLLFAISVQVFASLPSYTGTITLGNGLSGTGAWVDKLLLPEKDQADWVAPQLTWTVSQNADLSWHYSYSLVVNKNAISHFIVEASSTFTASNIWNASGPFSDTTIQTYSDQNGNPGMPGVIWGIKFNGPSGTSATYAFDSDRAPVWGDFYAKDGATAHVNNVLWNTGFSTATPHLDPNAPISDGSYQDHILVPDTVTSIPEPASFVALASGVLGLLGMMRRRNRK